MEIIQSTETAAVVAVFKSGKGKELNAAGSMPSKRLHSVVLCVSRYRHQQHRLRGSGYEELRR